VTVCVGVRVYACAYFVIVWEREGEVRESVLLYHLHLVTIRWPAVFVFVRVFVLLCVCVCVCVYVCVRVYFVCV